MIALTAVLLAAGAPEPPAALAAGQCNGSAATLPAEFAGWPKRRPVDVASADAAAVPIAIGQAVDVRLAPASGADAGSAGVLAFRVAAAGTIRVALGTAASADVVANGTVLPSSGHAHGPACSSIRKIVDFQLVPGNYLLRISRSPDAQIAVMVAAER